ncbi:hypothetical protein ONO97_08135, partial [Salmonella enterica subsp. enterica serovar Anatum]|nr:hypothetical protein [Salmonella enterica subsp. enterica serovar Anatum]
MSAKCWGRLLPISTRRCCLCSAAAVRREVAEYLRPPRRMPVAEGIKQFMFVPRGANTAVPW